jgi:hypothetical protein
MFRFGPFEFHPELWSFEDAGDDENTTVSDSSDEEDSDPLNADWESVSESFINSHIIYSYSIHLSCIFPIVGGSPSIG